MFNPRRILVAVDSLEPADRAVDIACDIATKFSSELTILYLSPVLHSGDGSAIDVTGQVYQVLEETIQTRIDISRQKLIELEEHARELGVKASGRMLDSFDGTAKTILEIADELKADLLVISSEARHGLSQILFGTLSEEISSGAKMPVLVIHSGNK